MQDPVELEAVWWPGGEGNLLTAGKYGCKRIQIHPSGSGGLGPYDIIRVEKEDGAVEEYVAQHCEGWRLKERKEVPA